MRASYRWLKELSGVTLDAAAAAERLCAVGIEVEGIAHVGCDLAGVVVAEVRSRRPHPKRPELTLVDVFDGKETLKVVCGAANVPEPATDAKGRSAKVALARVGAQLPGGLKIEARSVGGEPSHGMLCSEAELAIGADAGGILVFESSAPGGTALTEALTLEDWVFDLSLTPNRPDCLGHLGLARELAVAARAAPVQFGDEIAVSAVHIANDVSFAQALPPPTRTATADVDFAGRVGAFRLEVAPLDRCPRYTLGFVDGIRVAPAPFWVRYRLHCLGMRAIDAVVDATNLVMLELGHPVHAFDLDAIAGGIINVRCAKLGEKLVLLDGAELELAGDDLVIADAERPLALAGVMGGHASGVSSGSRRLAVEAAYFDPRGIRRAARRHGLHTESSHRFERGVDPDAVRIALRRTLGYVTSWAGGAAADTYLEQSTSIDARVTVGLRATRLHTMLDTAELDATVTRTLTSLGSDVETAPDGWRVRVPSWRPDLRREVDLIEEVARVWGYDRLPSRVPQLGQFARSGLETWDAKAALRRAAAAAGLTEVIGYAFASEADVALFDASESAITLNNPLSEERGRLRASLLPSLLRNLETAQRWQVETLRVFEMARVFARDERGEPRETLMLGVLLWGERRDWVQHAGVLDFFDAKGAIDTIVKLSAGEHVTTVRSAGIERELTFLHPRRCAYVLVDDTRIGVIGEVHPEVVERYGLQGRPFVAQLEVAPLIELGTARGVRRAKPAPRLPAVTRDLALIVDEQITAGEIIDCLTEQADGLVETVDVFDIYRGAPVPDGKKSVAFRLKFRDAQATLTDERVDRIHKKLVETAASRFQAGLR